MQKIASLYRASRMVEQHSAGDASTSENTDEDRHSPSSPSDDLFTVTPDEALQLFSAGMEALIRMPRDVAPPPAPGDPPAPQPESIVLSDSTKDRAELAAAGILDSPLGPGPLLREPPTYQSALDLIPTPAPESIDGIFLRDRSPPQPTTSPQEDRQQHWPRQQQQTSTPELHITICATTTTNATSRLSEPQRAFIVRKLSSRPPQVSLADYLARIHRHCRMTTGVYLAASLYVRRAAVAVTPRSAHRLALAALSVACKALEDDDGAPRPGRLAGVGGVGPGELGRMEVYLCFLVGFGLVVRGEEMWEHCQLLRRERDGR